MARFVNPSDAAALVADPVSFELAADFGPVAVVAPTYLVLATLAVTTIRPASFLKFTWTNAWIHQGAFAGNAAFNVRFRLNGGLLVGGATDNKVRNQIGTVARTWRGAVTAGVQTLDVEVTKFGAAGNTLGILPVTLPDLMHAALTMEEQT